MDLAGLDLDKTWDKQPNAPAQQPLRRATAAAQTFGRR